MRHPCLNHPTISCWTRMTPKPHTWLNMDTVRHVRQCEGILCTLMYIYSRWNVDWWPEDRYAGSMPERMFKIIYSSPYALHETATSSHIVKYWYRITCPSTWKHNVYINVHLQSMKRRGTFDWIAKMALFWLFCLLTIHTACCSVYWTHIRHAQLPTYKASYRWLRACTVNG